VEGPPPLCVQGAVHPLLLEPTLDPLPQPPSAEDQPFAANFQAVPSFWGAPGGSRGRSSEARRPRPLDLRVPAGISVVAITGPNTGRCPQLPTQQGWFFMVLSSGLRINLNPSTAHLQHTCVRRVEPV
jgi:hypothetical protein